MIIGTILLYIVGLFIFYLVIFTAVKDGIDRSETGQLIQKKYGVEKKIVTYSDEEIEKELEDEFKK